MTRLAILMKTQFPISSISWNSPQFLTKRLNELIDSKVIDFYAFILHQADEDVGKVHFHLYCEPVSRIDTVDFRELFVELPSNLSDNATDDEKKPLRPLKFVKSKFDDWYLYSLHEVRYLESKGLKRNIHYEQSDIFSNDYEELQFKVSHIDYSKMQSSRIEQIKDAVKHNVTFDTLVFNGVIPVQQIKQYEQVYMMYRSYFLTERGDDKK